MPGTWFNLGAGSPSVMQGSTGHNSRMPPSGNQAFDAYRADAISRLEEEQREFESFLKRLRQARDKAEFDAFMADRRGRPDGEDTAEPAATPD